jgi:hypothetical protein
MKSIKLFIIALISLVTFTVEAQMSDSAMAVYDSAVCQDAISDIGNPTCAKYVDYLYYNWKGDVNDFDSLEQINFCTVTGTLVTVYGADTVALIITCQITQGTPARLFNMSFSKNKRNVMNFAELFTYFIDYSQTGLDKDSLIGENVYGYEVENGRKRTGTLVYINTEEKYGVIERGNRTYKCNLFTIH